MLSNRFPWNTDVPRYPEAVESLFSIFGVGGGEVLARKYLSE